METHPEREKGVPHPDKEQQVHMSLETSTVHFCGAVLMGSLKKILA